MSVAREELETLLDDIDVFTSKIFDHVTHLERVDFLHQCYDFRHTVEEKIKHKGEAPCPQQQ